MDTTDLKRKVENVISGNKKQAMLLGAFAVIVVVMVVIHMTTHH